MSEPATPDVVPDSEHRGLVARLPQVPRDLAQLARFDRPIGWWLLFWPCAWGVWLSGAGWQLEVLAWLLLGAIAMRGAGCVYNDIVDADLDRRVARTALRPVASGRISKRLAWGWLLALCTIGLLVLLQLRPLAQAVALASVALVAAYPFMKRITWWPQAWLGLTFNWGVLVAGATALGTPFAPEILLLYGANLFWTLGYDTIYACQDMEDDAMVGVKSSARALGGKISFGVLAFYRMTAALAALAGLVAGAGLMFAPAFAVFAAHLLLQTRKLDPEDGRECLRRFKANQITGLLLAGAFLLGAL